MQPEEVFAHLKPALCVRLIVCVCHHYAHASPGYCADSCAVEMADFLPGLDRVSCARGDTDTNTRGLFLNDNSENCRTEINLAFLSGCRLSLPPAHLFLHGVIEYTHLSTRAHTYTRTHLLLSGGLSLLLRSVCFWLSFNGPCLPRPKISVIGTIGRLLPPRLLSSLVSFCDHRWAQSLKCIACFNPPVSF